MDARPRAEVQPRRARTESRWFVPGGVEGCRRPPGAAVERTDLYQRSTLTPSWSVKLRGGTTLEHKVRTGRIELVEIGGVRGFAETWLKMDARHFDRRPDGPWTKVRKELWRGRGIEIGRLHVDGQRWWTVCVDAAATRRPPAMLERWHDVLIAHGEPHSYASWLLGLEAGRSGRRRR